MEYITRLWAHHKPRGPCWECQGHLWCEGHPENRRKSCQNSNQKPQDTVSAFCLWNTRMDTVKSESGSWSCCFFLGGIHSSGTPDRRSLERSTTVVFKQLITASLPWKYHPSSQQQWSSNSWPLFHCHGNIWWTIDIHVVSKHGQSLTEVIHGPKLIQVIQGPTLPTDIFFWPLHLVTGQRDVAFHFLLPTSPVRTLMRGNNHNVHALTNHEDKSALMTFSSSS